MRDVLTERQHEVLTFIEERVAAGKPPPTLREIGKALGISSTNGVMDHLRVLERKGWIIRDPMHARAIRLVGDISPSYRKIRAALVRMLWLSVADRNVCTCDVDDLCPDCEAFQALYSVRWPGADKAAARLTGER